ncbi:MAG: peptidase MA family metallohydrolase [Candidatus Orphnella occulta]|nr:peptidase MA family metallohydrolase [Candidatus Orphnella occulta]
MSFHVLKEQRTSKMGHRLLCPILLFMTIFIILAFLPLPALCSLSDDFNRKGIEKMRENNYREAIIYFESAYKADLESTVIKKNLSAAYHNIAVAYSAKNELASAIYNEKQALRYAPESNIIREQLSIFYNNYGLQYADSGDYNLAMNNLEYALEHSTNLEPLRKNLYNVLLQYTDYLQKKKNYRKALRLSRDAIELLPDLPVGYIVIGNIYYNQDNFSDTLEYWEMALERDPENTNLSQRIKKLKRESSIENTFGTKRKSYFRIRFDKELDSDYVGLISDALEDARASLRREFNLHLDEVITVVVYADEQFEVATNQPHWTQGLYDGKIRIKSLEISRGDKFLRSILFHEYSHAIIYINYGSNIPVWLHEGFAQFNEPGRNLNSADMRFLSEYMRKNKRFSIEELNGMFDNRSDQDIIRAAYIQARLFFTYLMENYSKYKMKRLFNELEQGKIWQEALKAVYHKNIARIDRDFNNYLDGFLIRDSY